MSALAAATRANAARILLNPNLQERQRWIALWNFFLATELKAGSQFLRAKAEDQLYIVLGANNAVVKLPRAGRGGDVWHAYFQTTYGFGEREAVSKFIYDALRSYTISHGTPVELRRFAVYDRKARIAYLSCYNGSIRKIEGTDKITQVSQGEDSVFFADDEDIRGEPCEVDIGPHGLLLERLARPNFVEFGAAGTTREQQRMALITWMFLVAFPDIAPTKPILLVEGVKGSGKTSVVTWLQYVLFGAKDSLQLQRNKEDDFGVVLLRKPIALLDNLDSYIDWLPDAVCAYCTGGTWTKRKLYSDDDSVILRPHAFIAVATRNPASFRRDDVVDRCVILRFERRQSFVPQEQLEAGLLADRPKLLGEYLWFVGRIVEELRRAEARADETQRMADFAAFARVVGRVMGWADDAVQGMLEALQAERDAFLNEEDPLIDLLQAWIKHPNGGRSNVGRTVSVFQLCADLEAFALVQSLPWKETPRTLAQKLRSTHIEREFHVETSTVNGHKAFQIWRHSDARLGLVPMPVPTSE